MKYCAILLLISLTLLSPLYGNENSNRTERGNCFVGTSAFMLVNLIPNQENPPGFAQLNFGYWLTEKDVISLEAITWKYRKPLGIGYGESKGDSIDFYPGTVRDFGVGLVYQRYFRRGLYAAQHITPFLQTYEMDAKGKEKGFMLFLTTRVGYHFRIRERVFFEPSWAFTCWPVRKGVPSTYKQRDDEWKLFKFEPGFHVGFVF